MSTGWHVVLVHVESVEYHGIAFIEPVSIVGDDTISYFAADLFE